MKKGRLVSSETMSAEINQANKRSGFLISYVLVLGVFFSANCLAEEWYVQPSFSLRTEYDDNKRLLTDKFVRDFREKEQKNGRSGNVDLSAYGIITTAEAKAGVRSETFDIFFKGRVAVKKYFSDFDFDSEDFFLDLNSSYQVTQRNLVGFSAVYNQETTLTAELDDTGLTQDNIPRTTWSVSPYWIYTISETKDLQASYLHQEVSYEQSKATQFTDYIYDVVSLTFSHRWNEKLTNSATASWFKVQYPSIKREEDQYSINGTLDYEFSDTWTASLSGGVQYTQTEIESRPPQLLGRAQILSDNRIFLLESGREISSEGISLTNTSDFFGLTLADASIETPAFSDSKTAFVFSFGTEKQFEKGNIGASYSRSTSPTGFGSLRTVDRFSIDFLHKITKHFHFLLDGQVHITKSTLNENSQFSNQDRTYYSVTPSLRWQFNRQLSLTGGYRYRRQEYDASSNTNNANVNIPESVAESNAVFFTLKYQWDKFTTREF